MIQLVIIFLSVLFLLIIFNCLFLRYQYNEYFLPNDLIPLAKVYDDNYNSQFYKKDTMEYIPPNLNKLRESQVPTLNTEQCYKSRYYECPIVNGTLLQCTNNYIPYPKEYNADCGNRTFDMVPYPWKISENAYYNKIGFDPEKEFKKKYLV